LFYSRIVAASVLGLAILGTSGTAQAAVTLSGPSATAFLTTEAGGERFRALATSAAQQELYVGRSDLGAAVNRVAGNITYTQNGDNAFSLAYNAGTDLLTGTIKNTTVSYSNFLASLSPGVRALAFNTLQFQITDRAAGAGLITLKNLKLNSVSLTPSTLAAVDNSTQYFALTGYNFKQSFSLTGDIGLSGTFSPSVELNKIDVLIGNNSRLMMAVPEPATWAMMILGFGAIGSALRRRRAFAVA
jgi:hypothetical protein